MNLLSRKRFLISTSYTTMRNIIQISSDTDEYFFSFRRIILSSQKPKSETNMLKKLTTIPKVRSSYFY